MSKKLGSNIKASEVIKKEYPHIYDGYMAIVEEQLELFSKKHLDYFTCY
jgi:hypothetical protein